MHCKIITVTAQGHTTTKCAGCSRLQLLFLVLISTTLMQGCDTVHVDQFLLYSSFICSFLLFLMLLLLLVYFIAIYLWCIFTFTFRQIKFLIMDEFIVILHGLFCFKVFVTQVTAKAIFMLFTHVTYPLLLIFTFKSTYSTLH